MCTIILITHKKHTRVPFTPAEQSLQPRCLSEHVLHARASSDCAGFYWQGWRKHTKRVLPGALPRADLTPLSAGNNFLALQCGLKTMEKKPSQQLILVRISTWTLKTALPDFMCWREIYNRDSLQITQKDATRSGGTAKLRLKCGACPERAATNISNFHSQYLPPVSKLLHLSFTCSFNINCFWSRGEPGKCSYWGENCCLLSWLFLLTSFPRPSLLPPPHGSCSLTWSLPRGNLQVWSKEARLGYQNNLLLNLLLDEFTQRDKPQWIKLSLL